MVQAKQLLENLYTANLDQETEKDTLMLLNSLLGILKKQSADHNEQIEGMKMLEKAKELSDEAGGSLLERKKWLMIPDSLMGESK